MAANEAAGMTACNDSVPMPQQHLTDLESRWEEQMEGMSLKKKHSHVEVLMLYWNKVSPSYLDTEPEIGALRRVLEDSYSFNVRQESLNPPGDDKSPTLLITKYVADLLVEHDKPETLLIIYYAGHGHPDENGRSLILRGGNNHNTSVPTPGKNPVRTAKITWESVNKLIGDTAKADYLVIFDCCYAGLFGNPYINRSCERRNVEYIGACSAQEFAAVPGDHSFTFALTEALKELASSPNGFTTSQLHSKIMQCPSFAIDTQTPCFFSWTDSLEKLQIVPLTKSRSGDETTTTDFNNESSSVNLPYCLRLDFHLARLPTLEQIDQFCGGLRSVANQSEYQIPRKIVWKSLHRRDDPPPVVHKVVKKWKKIAKNVKRKRNGASPGAPAKRPQMARAER